MMHLQNMKKKTLITSQQCISNTNERYFKIICLDGMHDSCPSY